MNCKQGDLAVFVKSRAGNEGKVVRCVRYVGAVSQPTDLADFWVIDRPVSWAVGGKVVTSVRLASDSMLRPIRPDEGDDETLSWAGKPEKVAA